MAKRCAAAALLLALSVLLCACAGQPNGHVIVHENEPHSEYGNTIGALLPSYACAPRTRGTFMELQKGAAVEAFDSQAVPALEAGVASHWYPHYLATVVIAVDRGQTDAKIGGWADLCAAGVEVSMSDASPSLGHMLAAVSFALDGEDFSLHSAARLLAPLYEQGRLTFGDYDAPLVICYDFQAAAMKKAGRNMETIVPSEGTLSFVRGLLSNAPLDIPGSREALLGAGYRLPDGDCDESLYPPATAYARAATLSGYGHLNAEIQNTTKIVRREIQHTRVYTSADNHEHQVFALVYIVVVIVWVGLIAYRAMQKGVRLSAFVCCALLIGWLLVRMFKYQLVVESVVSRYAWYGFYIFQMGLPLAVLWMALAIDKPADTLKPPKWWLYLLAGNVALVLLVLTNDLHRLAFRMDITSNGWSRDYSYGPLYFLVLAVVFSQALLSQVILVQKSRKSPRRFAFLFPLALYAAMLSYCIGYILRIPIAWDSDMTIATGVGVLLFMETCIQIGLIPVNRRYRRFFRHSPHSMQIADKQGNVALASDGAEPLFGVTLQVLRENGGKPMVSQEDDLLYAGEITGGTVVWREDIRSLNALNCELEASLEKIEAANALLVQQEELLSLRATTEERIRLFSALEEETRHHTKDLSSMLHSIPEAQGAQRLHMALIALQVCYIKRRCNLFFVERDREAIAANELAVYVDELAEFAGLAGTKSHCSCELTGAVNLRYATLMYDFFYALLTWLPDHGCHAVVMRIYKEADTLALKAMCEDAVGFGVTPELALRIEAAGGSISVVNLMEAFDVCLSFPKGGRRDG